jgi:succinoglycan biosynthesis protein ExoA
MTRVLVHAHSTWSHDGHLPLDAYLELTRRVDCSVVLLTEHEESGWTAERYDAYVRVCSALSTKDVCLLPGIEFNQDGYHILCYGLRALPRRPSTIADLAADVHRQGCVLTLAHPGKYQWLIPASILDGVDAIEIWNSKWIYDGGAGPHPSSRRLAARRLKTQTPAHTPRVMIGQDIHKLKHLSPLVLITERGHVLDNIADGRYEIAWKDRRWSPEALRDTGSSSPARARLHRAWMEVVLSAYRATRPLRGVDASTSRTRIPRLPISSVATTSSAATSPIAAGDSSAAGSSATSSSQPALWPMVSVILPIRNEASFIERALSSVLAQDYPADRLEIIVADGCSTDGTREIVQRFAAPATGRLRLIDNAGRIVSTGMNAALAVASGDVIVRVDGHCEIPADFVRRSVEHLQRDGVDCVGGLLDTIGETRMARVTAAVMSARFGVGGSAFRSGASVSTLTDTVAFPAFTRAAMGWVGPFDEELVRNQDDEYSYRLRRLGGRILLATDIRARYYSRGTLRSLWRQCFQYGYWKVRVLQKHPRQMRMRQFVPALFVACLSILPLLSVVSPFPLGSRLSLGVMGSIVLLYLTAAGAASWQAARRGGFDLLPWLPLAFTTLHVAYGAGSLIGLVAFWKRWRTLGSDEVYVHGSRSVLPPRHS